MALVTFEEDDIRPIHIFGGFYLGVNIPEAEYDYVWLNLGYHTLGEKDLAGEFPAHIINLRHDYTLPPGWEWPDNPELVAVNFGSAGVDVALIHKCGMEARICQAGDDRAGGVFDRGYITRLPNEGGIYSPRRMRAVR